MLNSISPQLDAISGKINEAMRHQIKAEVSLEERYGSTTGSDAVAHARNGRDRDLDALNDMLASNERRRVAAVQRKSALERESLENESEALANSRKQIEALDGMVSLMKDQAASSTSMGKHQKVMNWLILSATVLGLAAAITFGVMSIA